MRAVSIVPVHTTSAARSCDRMRATTLIVVLLVAASCGRGPSTAFDGTVDAAVDSTVVDAPVDSASPTDAQLSSAKELFSFGFSSARNSELSVDVAASINGTAITAALPFANVTSLVPTFVTTGEVVTVSGLPQTSGVTTNDFTSSVNYLVTAADGSAKTYTVTVSAHSLTDRADFPTVIYPQSVVAGDFNADGKPDLAVANAQGANTVSVMLDTTVAGSRTTTFAPRVDLATGAGPLYLLAGDMNGDGRPDLITANHDASTVSILCNTTASNAATPSFAPKVDFSIAYAYFNIAIGDLNGDGKLDLAIANKNANVVTIWLNTTPVGASPSFAPAVDFATGSMPAFVTIGDLDGDGRPDLAVGTAMTVSVLINQATMGASTPAFAPHVDFSIAGGSESIALVDLDGDGKRDLAIAGYQDIISLMRNTTMQGDAVPSFASRVDYSNHNWPLTMVAGDVNGDGSPDLVTANLYVEGTGGSRVSIFQGTTAVPLALAPDVEFDVGSFPTSVAIADFNLDGRPDVAATSFGQGIVSVLLGR